ncbi:Nuclear hormone receptor family member daf-12 [Caenorhabditis elegans]|uniref:Nuclear hormone receptor family member daf-12 n=2 Tax=Caenorhabditis elegans TaxID=6239 RepID=A0A6V7QYS9_CAEEL|nr:Nuclear hormone receptor family member daf-12 [Caenorhabditis elegans]CAD1857027.1 Nuclear hormone receptor family member daf-12 [Caenorhabditis elegans]
MGTNGGVIAEQSMEIETNENPDKVEEPVVRRKRVTRRRHRRIHSKNNCLTPPNSDDDPQMSTPDDPVIHSPPSIGAAPGMNGYHGSGVKLEESSGACGSPDDGLLDSSEESRRRQKTCRVCGDHATGYNFNVITCESCKAFFRRNALRPKEFKCPYSEDCEINSVSRRFCQKCRLRKCFTVGMKKEWILNEEQLRRRKNSRLNNTGTCNKRSQPGNQQSPQGPNQQPHLSPHHPGVAIYPPQPQRPLTINPMDNQMMHHMQANRPNAMPQLISPPGAQPYPLTSPVGSSASDSPPNRSLTMMHNGEKSPDGYDPNIMAHRAPPPSFNNRPKMDSGQVVLSTEEYKQLLSRIPGAQVPGLMNEEEPINKRAAYNCNGHPMPAETTPPYSAPMSDMSLSRHNSTSSGNSAQNHFDIASFGMGIVTATGGGDAAEEMYKRMNMFYENCIQSALDSPENQEPKPQEAMIPKEEYMTPTHGFQYQSDPYQVPPAERNINYQLNAAELKALDAVREAFYGMDDPMEQGRQMQSFLKANKTPADIMNIMDVTMRRFVKVAKGVPAFREVSQEGKFSLLKGGMIEMLTVRGVTRYDASTNSFKTPTIKGQNVSVNVDDMFAKLNANAQAQKAKCLEFFGFFDEEIKKNELAVYLVMLAVLFSVRSDPPMNENDVRIVTERHNHFMSLLNRYLESLFGEQARRIFERIPKALGLLNEIARNAGMLFMGTVRSGEAEELPGEFFKIK